ncbi:MAG: DUF5110 domain-containing protein, partial [Muribaculaceae bacterium]|nr:DUF5110 domain-containing protein [Muribaculaceae bacterium]
WYDFWSNEIHEGGKDVKFIAPINRMPIYVKAGSIIPFGPAVQYTTEKPWDSLELRVYPGEDGEFVLYEDDGSSYNYEKGEYTEIPMKWDEASRTLTIGERRGSYPQMIPERTFNVAVMEPGSEPGNKAPSSFVKSVKYTGAPVSIQI